MFGFLSRRAERRYYLLLENGSSPDLAARTVFERMEGDVIAAALLGLPWLVVVVLLIPAIG